jgi:lysophospholipase L1-like esterase
MLTRSGVLGRAGNSLPTPAYSVDLTLGSLPSFIASSTRSESVAVATYFDSNGDLQTAALNAPRFGHDFFSHQPTGYMSEPTSTNMVRNNTMQGVGVGTPGTPPNFWSVTTNSNGLSTQIVGTGTIHNLNYVDFRTFGTTTGTGSTQLYFEATNNITTTQNTFRNSSAFLAIQGGSNTNVSNISLDLDQRDSGNAALALIAGLNIKTNVLFGILARFVNNIGATASGVAFSSPLLTITPSGSGVAIDITVRVAMPQLESGYSSVIATTNGAVTRNTDSAQFNAALTTLFANKIFSVVGATDGSQATGLGAAGAQSNNALIGGAGSQRGLGYTSPNTVTSPGLTNNLQLTLNYQIGLAQSATTQSLTNNGGALYGGSVASGSAPVATGPYFANTSSGFGAVGSVAALRIWSITLSNAQLQTATLPPNVVMAWGDSITAGTGSITPATNYGYIGYLDSLRGAYSYTYRMGYAGQGSAFIAAQMIADTSHINDTVIIEVGRNDVGGGATVIANIQSMISHLAPGNTRYVVLSIVNTTAENSASSGTNLSNYNWIIAMNAAMATAFSGHYLDVRSAVVSASGGANDAPAASYMYMGSVHGNDASYQVWATQIKAFGHAAGWPGF